MSNARITKSDIINILVEGGVEVSETELKKLTVKKLRALAEEYQIPLEMEEVANDGLIRDDEVSDAKTDALVEEGREKFEYLQDKDPSQKHEFYAALMTALSGIEITPKQYQVMICTHRYIQASDLNRVRKDYRPRTAESVIQAAATLQARAEELITDDAGAVISKGLNHIPEHLVELVMSKLTPEPTEEEVAEAVEQAEEEFADA